MKTMPDYLGIARLASSDVIGAAAGKDRFTFAELDVAAEQLSSLLPPGEQRIGVVMPNGPSWTAVLAAVWRRGSEAALLPARLPASALVETARREGVSVLVVDEGRTDEIAGLWAGPMIEVQGLSFRPVGSSSLAADWVSPLAGKGPGVTLFTSGTTGSPKAVRLSLAALSTAVEGTIAHLTQGRTDHTQQPDRRTQAAYLIAFPLYHVSGLFLLILAMARQSPAVILERFSTGAFLDALEHWPIRQIVLNPAMLTELVECRDSRADALVGQLVLVRSGSAPLSPHLRAEFCRRFRVPLLQGYGATETGGEVAGWTARDFREHGDRKADSVGRCKPGVSIEIRDDADRPLKPGEVGRVAVRVPWFSHDFQEMGDLGYLDDEGFLFLVGRADDVINCGGFKIHPAAVEDALSQCPEIAECAVVPEPDGRLGQVPVAYVVPKESDLTSGMVDTVARATLLPYQCPRRIYIVDALPRNDLGKLLRSALRDSAPEGPAFTGERRS